VQAEVDGEGQFELWWHDKRGVDDAETPVEAADEGGERQGGG